MRQRLKKSVVTAWLKADDALNAVDIEFHSKKK